MPRTGPHRAWTVLRSAVLFGLVSTALVHGVEVAKSGGIAIIVNIDNPFPKSLPISSLRALFLGDTRRLGGQKAIPTLTQDKEALATFYATLLETNESAFKSQWLKKVFSDGLQPPAQMKTSQELIQWVRQTPNGVAVLPARDALNKKGEPLSGLVVVLVIQ